MSIETTHVRELVNGLRGAAETFQQRKIDYYRIGSLQLWEAALRQNCDLAELTSELSSLPAEIPAFPTRTRDLIRYLGRRYHSLHDNRLFVALRLARRLDFARDDNPGFPSGVANLLKVLGESLADHCRKEAEALFPAMLRGAGRRLQFPVLRMIMEHDDISDQLDTLARLLNDYVPPDTACEDWKQLCAVCRQFDSELRFHIHLENNVLFPRFVADRVLAS